MLEIKSLGNKLDSLLGSASDFALISIGLKMNSFRFGRLKLCFKRKNRIINENSLKIR